MLTMAGRGSNWRYVVGSKISTLGKAAVGSVCKQDHFPQAIAKNNSPGKATAAEVMSTGPSDNFLFFDDSSLDLRGHKVCFRSYKADDYGTVYSRVWQIPYHGLQLLNIQITANSSQVSADDGRSNGNWRYVVGGSKLSAAAVGSPCQLAYFPDNISSSPGQTPASEIAATGTGKSFKIYQSTNLRGEKVCFRSHQADRYGTVYSYVWQIPVIESETNVGPATPVITVKESGGLRWGDWWSHRYHLALRGWRPGVKSSWSRLPVWSRLLPEH